jgi:hypothetical protein
LAESQNKTVRELLDGVPGPISMEEFQNWNTFFKVKAYYQEQQRDGK